MLARLSVNIPAARVRVRVVADRNSQLVLREHEHPPVVSLVPDDVVVADTAIVRRIVRRARDGRGDDLAVVGPGQAFVPGVDDTDGFPRGAASGVARPVAVFGVEKGNQVLLYAKHNQARELRERAERCIKLLNGA